MIRESKNKTYSFIIITAIIFSGYFLYKHNNDSSKIIPSSSDILEKINEVSKIKEVIPDIVNKVPSATITNNIPITEIDDNEIDRRPQEQKIDPCVTPIKYKIGLFDARFNISKNYFLQTINNSAELWNDAIDKKLFEYDSTGSSNSLVIDLIYDTRQQNTDNSKLLAAEIENTKNAATALKVEYEAMEETFSKLKDAYTLRLSTFNNDQKTYNDTVNSWNEKGGAPRTEYEALMLEKDRLQKESEYLAAEHSKLTSLLVDINTKIAKHNEFVAFANERVALNNNVAYKKFTEGNYNPNTNKITIYQFNDDIKLSRVLTHELGHVLGLDHSKNKQSIMYAVNSGTSTVLSKDDINAVISICPQN